MTVVGRPRPIRVAAAVAAAGGVVVAVASAGGAIGYVAVDRTGRRPGAGSADAVVVLGAEVVGQRPCGELRARLDHAAAVWRQGRAPVVVCCGGLSRGVDENVVMANYLVDAGVDADAVSSLDGATTRRSMAAVADAGYSRILVVSSPYHLHRAVAEARRHGLTAVGCPAPGSPEQADPAMRRLRTATEVVASAWYALPAAITDVVATDPSTVRHRVPLAVAARLRRR